MIELDPRREKFAQGVASGLSQAEAYRRANANSAKWKEKTIMNRASEWANDRDISGRIAELRAELASAALWSREDSIRALKDVVADPDKKADVVASVKELNAMHGYNAPQKIEQSGSLSIRVEYDD